MDEFELLVDTLIEHQRLDIDRCQCGWGVKLGSVGKSHARHVAGTFFDKRADLHFPHEEQ